MNVPLAAKALRQNGRIQTVLRRVLGAARGLFLIYRLYDVIIVPDQYGP
jgi:hypothetical protein